MGDLLTTQDRAVWSTAMQNDLPDNAFAAVEPGGATDADGKTTPRALRHLPLRGPNGKYDEAHVRDALSRLPETKLPAALLTSAKCKVLAAAKSVGIATADEQRRAIDGAILLAEADELRAQRTIDQATQARAAQTLADAGEGVEGDAAGAADTADAVGEPARPGPAIPAVGAALPAAQIRAAAGGALATTGDGGNLIIGDESGGGTTRVMWAPVTRIDQERREIEGILSSEAVDTFGTIFAYEDMKRAITDAWHGNVREQHDRYNAVGRKVDVRFDDATKQVWLRARISRGAESTWQKILDGTLSGFSIAASGCRVVEHRTVGGKTVPVLGKFGLAEVSVVDAASNPDALASGLTVYRAQGVTDPVTDALFEDMALEQAATATPTPAATQARATVDAPTPAEAADVGGVYPEDTTGASSSGTAADDDLDEDGDEDELGDPDDYDDPSSDSPIRPNVPVAGVQDATAGAVPSVSHPGEVASMPASPTAVESHPSARPGAGVTTTGVKPAGGNVGEQGASPVQTLGRPDEPSGMPASPVEHLPVSDARLMEPGANTQDQGGAQYDTNNDGDAERALMDGFLSTHLPRGPEATRVMQTRDLGARYAEQDRALADRRAQALQRAQAVANGSADGASVLAGDTAIGAGTGVAPVAGAGGPELVSEPETPALLASRALQARMQATNGQGVAHSASLGTYEERNARAEDARLRGARYAEQDRQLAAYRAARARGETPPPLAFDTPAALATVQTRAAGAPASESDRLAAALDRNGKVQTAEQGMTDQTGHAHDAHEHPHSDWNVIHDHDHEHTHADGTTHDHPHMHQHAHHDHQDADHTHPHTHVHDHTHEFRVSAVDLDRAQQPGPTQTRTPPVAPIPAVSVAARAVAHPAPVVETLVDGDEERAGARISKPTAEGIHTGLTHIMKTCNCPTCTDAMSLYDAPAGSDGEGGADGEANAGAANRAQGTADGVSPALTRILIARETRAALADALSPLLTQFRAIAARLATANTEERAQVVDDQQEIMQARSTMVEALGLMRLLAAQPQPGGPILRGSVAQERMLPTDGRASSSYDASAPQQRRDPKVEIAEAIATLRRNGVLPTGAISETDQIAAASSLIQQRYGG